MAELEAVLFDLDDTLYPERQYVYSGFSAVAHWVHSQLNMSAESCVQQLTALFDGGERRHTFDVWLAINHPESVSLVSALVSVYRNHTPVISLFPDVLPILHELRRRFRLGILTDGIREVQERKISVLALEDLFDVIILSDSLGREAWKPSPRGYEAALEALGVEPKAAAYVGDNPAKDFLGARRAGLWSVRIRRDNGLHTRVMPPSPDHAPDATITCLGDLMGALHHIQRQLQGQA